MADNTTTVRRPRRWREAQRGERPPYAWDERRSIGRGETLPLFYAGIILAFFATLICYAKGYTLLYGDAVAHLGIARRLSDAKYPGLSQLGGVWLPLPHLLMWPFVQRITWWQSGLGAAPMSILSFGASVAALWRLGRRVMTPRWVLVAVAFYALNPNLLYLASCAMTEVLFLALLLWTVEAAAAAADAMQAGAASRASRWLMATGLLIFGMVMTRYDGWVVGAAAWCALAYVWWRSPSLVRRQVAPWFALFTLVTVAGPLLWLGYNAHYEGDWLDWMRGPYSAAQIDRKTSPHGQHYREWHNPWRALYFYARTAQVDAVAWEWGFLLLPLAVVGLAYSGLRTRLAARSERANHVYGWRGASERFLWLVWVPLPFYIYSVAYGSVPIFIPQLYPHSYYNARYGVEMLPAMALFGALATERVWAAWVRGGAGWGRVAARLAGPVAMMLCVANSIVMMHAVPLVLKEGIVNATTRVPFEHALAVTIESFPLNADGSLPPVMMYTSAHIGAVQVAGRPLRSMVSEMDDMAWQKALADPAASAAYVIAMAGGPVDRAVTAHPTGLEELEVVCTTGQPCARVYRSTVWSEGR